MQLIHIQIHHRSLCHVNWQVDQGVNKGLDDPPDLP